MEFAIIVFIHAQHALLMKYAQPVLQDLIYSIQAVPLLAQADLLLLMVYVLATMDFSKMEFVFLVALQDLQMSLDLV
jgi:hypothetical protein